MYYAFKTKSYKEIENIFNYNIFLCPNGGDLSEILFRVGHIGNISDEDIDTLVNAFKDMNEKGVL